jgi:iron complex transport system permease protein
VCLASVAALGLAVLASLALGAVRVPPGQVLDALAGGDGRLAPIVTDIRLPRVVLAVLVGAALAMAGALLQGALGNVLAAPDILGVTAGAGLGGILVIIFMPDNVGILPPVAFVSGLIAATLVFLLAWPRTHSGNSVARLVLSGIAVASLFGALTSGVLVWQAEAAPSALAWLAGGFSGQGWPVLEAVTPYIAVGVVLAMLLARPLDRLALGDDIASSVGEHPVRVRLFACATGALLASAACAAAGLLGFVGLVVPHIARMAGGVKHVYVLIASGLIGSTLLLVADSAARLVIAPAEIPVGVVTVLFGVPVFLWLLRRTV